MDLLDQTPGTNTQETSSDMPDLEALMNPQQSDHPVPEENPNSTTNYGVFDANKANQKKIEESLNAPTHELPPDVPEEPTPPPPIPHSGSPKKSLPKGILFAIIALVLITLPVIGYFVNQRTKPVADIRNRAAESCAWCAGTDQCFQATGQNGTPVSTSLCATGNCCTGYSSGGGDNPQPQPTSTTSNYCAAIGSAPGCEGVIKNGPVNSSGPNGYCCFDNDSYGDRCGRELCEGFTPCNGTCLLGSSTCSQVGRSPGVGSCQQGICCGDTNPSITQMPQATPLPNVTQPPLNHCRTTGNSAPSCNGQEVNTSPSGASCMCIYSTLQNYDCMCVAPTSVVPPTTIINPTTPPGTTTNPNSCNVDNPSVVDSYITIPEACGATFTLHRYEADATPGTTSDQCVGTSSNHSSQTVGPGTYRPEGSCGKCVQIDATINGVNYGTAKYTGDCSSNPPSSAICQNIKIYKGDVMLMSNQYNSIKPGDQLTFAAVTAPSVTQARFTINNGIPQVTTTKNNTGELVTNYTVPQVTVVTQFTVQAEIFSDGQWR